MIPFPGLRSRLRDSLRGAIGDIAFGFTDGAVSVAGLVFGVAAGTSDSSIVVLAGTTGAVAAAVSMMAGRYLDIQSVTQEERASLATVHMRVRSDPEPYLREAETRLRSGGMDAHATAFVIDSYRANPDALVDHVMAYDVGYRGPGGPAPWAHAVWMFFAVLTAGCIPVIPFALLDIDTARFVSLAITGGGYPFHGRGVCPCMGLFCCAHGA